ncbi:sugar ABC transporter permease [Mycetocola sp. 2940]|uniref:sugar ABC transporter permease n=1 Tax=Mycetocola sp. 2940 TaxID=3156452 RepID=UPI003397625D
MTTTPLAPAPQTVTDPGTSPAHRRGGRFATGIQGSWWQSTGWRYLVAILALAFALFPVLFIVSAAINPLGTLQSTSVVPTSASLQNFTDLFNNPEIQFGSWFFNSILVTLTATVVTVLISAAAAFAFSRLRFRGRYQFLLGLLLLQMFPSLLALIALYLMFVEIGAIFPAFGLNSSLGLVLAYLGGVLGGNVWLLKGYYDTVPRELDEAALLDGASHAQTFFLIVLPLVKPILATVALLTFVGTYSEIMLASVFLTESDSKTVAVGLYGLIQGQRNANFGVFSAGALLASLPVLIVYLGLQKYLVGGLTDGSVKG